MKHNFERYCKDYEKIENYQKAKVDNFKGWHCHHRLETHTPDGERREADIGYEELKALGMYYNRPAEELIFLTSREHNAFKKGKPRSEETKQKIGEGNKGKRHSAETRRKIAEAHEGKHHSEETKQKIGEAKKGKLAGENHPMYGKHHSEESKKKMREAKKGNTYTKGRHWYNNGKENKFCFECPEGFVPGRIKKL